MQVGELLAQIVSGIYERLNRLEKEVERLKEIVDKMEPDV